MSVYIPEYLKYLDVYKNFIYIRNYQSEILHWDNGLYISDVKLSRFFESLFNILNYLLILGENISNKKIYTSEIKKETFDNINSIFKIETELKNIYVKLLSNIVYINEFKLVNKLKFYKFEDNNLLKNLIDSIDIIISNIYNLVNDLCSTLYYDKSQTINDRNGLLFKFIKKIMKKYGVIVDNFEDIIINDYESYIFHENYLQSLIFNRLYLNDKNITFDDFENLIKYISKYISFDSQILVNLTMKFVNKLENKLLSNVDLFYFIKNPLIENNCTNLSEKEMKTIMKIIFTNYILRYNDLNFSDYIADKLLNDIYTLRCNTIDKDDLKNLIDNFFDNFFNIYFRYSIMLIMVNDNIYFYKQSSLINAFTSILEDVIDNKNFFIYIQLLKQIYEYKRSIIKNGLISIQLNDDLNEVIQKCYFKLFEESQKLRDIFIEIKDNTLMFSNYGPIFFIFDFFEFLLTIQSLSSEDVENTEEYELFEDVRDKYVENEDEIKVRSTNKDLKYYIYYLKDMKRLRNYEKNDKQFLTKINDNDAISYGNLRISKSIYYEFPNKDISIVSFTKIKLKINNFNKNVIFLGEYHTRNELNYHYIQNELYKCNQQNKFLELLIEMNIHLYYLPDYKSKLNKYYDGVFNLSKFSTCIDDKSLRNVYSDITKDKKDNIFCFDNVWYQNIDYRSADLIFSYIFNSNFNNKSKERILLEKTNNVKFKDIDKLYMSHFYQLNTLNFINYTIKNFIINDKYIVFGNVYDFSEKDPLYKVIEKITDINIFKNVFKNELNKLSIKINKKLQKYAMKLKKGSIIAEPYLYYLNLYIIKDSPLYNDLYNNPNLKFKTISYDEIYEYENAINQLTLFDIYKMFVYQMCDYYNFIYNTYSNIDENTKNFILSNPINIFGYRSYQFLNNFTKNFDKNCIKNILCSFLLRDVNFRTDYYYDIVSLFINYHPLFCRFVYYYKTYNLAIRDSFIDINILNRIFFDYDIEDKAQNSFPEKCKNIILYAGHAHCSILLIYLTNCAMFPNYSNLLKYDLVIGNVGDYQGPLISDQDYKHIFFQNYKNTDVLLPTIVDNIET